MFHLEQALRMYNPEQPEISWNCNALFKEETTSHWLWLQSHAHVGMNVGLWRRHYHDCSASWSVKSSGRCSACTSAVCFTSLSFCVCHDLEQMMNWANGCIVITCIIHDSFTSRDIHLLRLCCLRTLTIASGMVSHCIVAHKIGLTRFCESVDSITTWAGACTCNCTRNSARVWPSWSRWRPLTTEPSPWSLASA